MGLQKSTIQDLNNCYSHYYLCRYLPLSAGRDTLSRSLVRFKQGFQPDLSGWIDCALEILAAHPEGAISPGSTIIRALHHQEQAANISHPTSLDQLGLALASRFRCRYSPNLVRKTRPTRESKGLTRPQREAELKGVYYIETSCGSPESQHYYNSVTPNPSFLIIDDVLTTAATLKMIARALFIRFPGSSIGVFTLAKADYDPDPDPSTALEGQDYRLEQGANWLATEENPTYYTREALKNHIRRGKFGS